MAFGAVLLCPKHRAGLKHPIIHAHHHLLVELRALGQDGRTVKIIEAEEVGTTLCALGSDLGRVDLGKALTVKEFPKGPYNALLKLEPCPLTDVAQRDGAIVQLRFKRSL